MKEWREITFIDYLLYKRQMLRQFSFISIYSSYLIIQVFLDDLSQLFLIKHWYMYYPTYSL